MQDKILFQEVFWLRSIACLAVTLGHAIGNGFYFYHDPTIYHTGLYILNMAVLFGVPVFIFISEFLLANKYQDNVPKDFLKKRGKILLLPYLFMSIIYALMSVETREFREVLFRIMMSLFLGDSAVYFILIIFQFYFLHLIFRQFLSKLSGKHLISIAFLVNFLYLAFFNFVESPSHTFGQFIWNKGYWIPFTGWIFFFALGFYCGRNHQKVMDILNKRKVLILIMPVVGLITMLLINKIFQLNYDSKRVDMLLYAPSIIFIILYTSSRIKKVPKMIMMINNYSFSIFLLNLFYFYLFQNIQPLPFLNIVSYSFFVFLLTLFLCIGTAYLFNRFKYGRYFVGRVMQYKVDNILQIRNEYSSPIIKPLK